MKAFQTGAEYYEALSDSAKRLDREGPLLRDVLGRAPGVRVLDLACGTGLHAAYMAEQGAQVTASDLSADMVAHAKQKRSHANLTFRTGDMRIPPAGPWDLVLCLGNSMTLLPSIKDVVATLRAVYDVLAPGGLFLVQILNYASEAAQQARHRVEQKRIDDAEIVAVKSLVPHEDRTLLSLTFFSGQGGEYTSVAESAVLLHVTKDALVGLAQDAGFTVSAVYGGFDRAEYDDAKSGDVVCVLEKVAKRG